MFNSAISSLHRWDMLGYSNHVSRAITVTLIISVIK